VSSRTHGIAPGMHSLMHRPAVSRECEPYR